MIYPSECALCFKKRMTDCLIENYFGDLTDLPVCEDCYMEIKETMMQATETAVKAIRLRQEAVKR